MLVVDASVAMKWFIQEPETADARALIRGQDPLIASDLVLPEVINVVLGGTRWEKRCRALLG